MRAVALVLLAALTPPGAAAAPPFDWVVTLENGDVLHCALKAIEAQRLVVSWEVSPEEPLRLDLKAVSSVVRPGEEGKDAETPPGDDMLRLQDDSILYGKAARIGPDGVEFDVPPLGRLAIPAASIIDLQRGSRSPQVPEARDGEFTVAMRSGVALTGKLRTDDRGRLVVESAGLTATVEDDSLAVLVFPRPSAEGQEDEQPVPGIEIKLRSGSVIGGRDPALADGSLRFRAGGVETAVPIADVASISFREYGPALGRGALRSVLAWGRWSDPAEEFRRTVDLVKVQTEGRWKITETMTDQYDEAFRRELLAARVLLIPEMERLPPNPTDAAEMKALLDSFLRAGGNVVVCGAQGPHLRWLRDAGLIELEGAGQVDGVEISFTAKGAAISRGIPAFVAVNATNAYTARGAGVVTLAEAGGKAVVVGRRVGRGWVIVIGADYYLTSEGATKLLGNAIQLR